jgi:hypothetical protein
MEENNNILSKFESFKDNNPYKVPENYFNTLLPGIQKKIEASEKRSGLYRNLNFRPMLKLSFLIAGIAFIAIIGFKTLSPFWSSNNNLNGTVDEIASYLDNQVFSFDELTILSVTETNKNESKIKGNDKNDTINYLINSNIDFYDIINEL